MLGRKQSEYVSAIQSWFKKYHWVYSWKINVNISQVLWLTEPDVLNKMMKTLEHYGKRRILWLRFVMQFSLLHTYVHVTSSKIHKNVQYIWIVCSWIGTNKMSVLHCCQRLIIWFTRYRLNVRFRWIKLFSSVFGGWLE